MLVAPVESFFGYPLDDAVRMLSSIEVLTGLTISVIGLVEHGHTGWWVWLFLFGLLHFSYGLIGLHGSRVRRASKDVAVLWGSSIAMFLLHVAVWVVLLIIFIRGSMPRGDALLRMFAWCPLFGVFTGINFVVWSFKCRELAHEGAYDQLVV